MRISDWSSDVCSSDLRDQRVGLAQRAQRYGELRRIPMDRLGLAAESVEPGMVEIGGGEAGVPGRVEAPGAVIEALAGDVDIVRIEHAVDEPRRHIAGRSEEHTSELQSLMRISYAVFC